MAAQKTLNERVIEAKALASLSKIISRDKHGRVSVVLVPGSEATRNQVIIRRHETGIISCECRKEAGAHGYTPCNGNISGVCRHSIAAIMVALNDQGYTPRFRKSLVQAKAFGEAHRHEVLTNPDTGAACIFTLKSKEHFKHYIYFAALENAARELKVSRKQKLADELHQRQELAKAAGDWHNAAPEKVAVSAGKAEINRTLSQFALNLFDTDDDGHPGHPNHYGDFNGVR